MRPIILLLALGLLLTAGACSGGDKDSFRNVDHDKNGKISYEELLFVFPEAPQDTFRKMDEDGDGMLSENEYAHFLKNETLAAASGKTTPGMPPATPKPAGPVAGTGDTSQPAVPYKGEEVIEITAPGADAGRVAPAKGKPEKGKKDQKQKTEGRGEATQYTVARGDNLTRIAQRFGLSVEDITKANGNMSPDTLRDGQVLTIPAHP
jgi:hypothetical protein